MLPVGAVIGAGASGLAAASGTAGVGLMAGLGAALFNPLTIDLGVVMGGLAMYQANQQNKAIKRQYSAIAKSAYENLDNLNRQITDTRVAYYDASDTASQGFRSAYASLVNGAGSARGNSVNAFMASQVASVNVDSWARQSELVRNIENIEYNKRNVKANAEAGLASAQSQTQNVALAGLGGAVQGVQMGMGFNNLITGIQEANALNRAYEQVLPAARSGDPLALARFQALNSGVRPSDVMGNYGSLYTDPLIRANNLNTLQYNSAMSSLNASRGMFDFTTKRLNESQFKWLQQSNTNAMLQTMWGK
jgi:hypothetical protein